MSPAIIVQFLLGLIFTRRNFWRWLDTRKSHEIPFRKDVVYRFLNDPRWNWRAVLSQIATASYQRIRPLTRHDAVFALDDSLYDRSRSQVVVQPGGGTPGAGL